MPKTITAWAFTFLDKPGKVEVAALPVAAMYDKHARREFMRPLLDAIDDADVVTGHNIIRFDLPIINAECHHLDLPTLKPVEVQDTIRIGRTNGFKKGQDNMAHALGVTEEKLPLSWAEWAAAYAEDDLATVKERCTGDVVMHVQMRQAMLERGWLKPARLWKP